ncbi:hypothetical protein GGQ95_002696, partial [Anoxybacillus rupiensis]|nr:hypothetical protein [Anoxybacillus rupiensis]
RKIEKIQKQVEKNGSFFSTCFILGTYQTAPFNTHLLFLIEPTHPLVE